MTSYFEYSATRLKILDISNCNYKINLIVHNRILLQHKTMIEIICRHNWFLYKDKHFTFTVVLIAVSTGIVCTATDGLSLQWLFTRSTIVVFLGSATTCKYEIMPQTLQGQQLLRASFFHCFKQTHPLAIMQYNVSNFTRPTLVLGLFPPLQCIVLNTHTYKYEIMRQTMIKKTKKTKLWCWAVLTCFLLQLL